MEPKTYWRLEPSQQAAGPTKLYLYDDVTKYGGFDWYTWSYSESETSANYFKEALEEIQDGSEIELHINSNGGSVSEGTTIYNLLKQKDCTVTGIVDGVAHSIAFLILQACDKRIMNLGTSALVHNMWMECYGNAEQLRKYADDLDTLMESNRQVFLERATIDDATLQELMDAETYLTPDKALEYGLIDEVATSQQKDNGEAQQKAMMQQLQAMRQQMNMQTSFKEDLKKLQQGLKDPEPKEPVNKFKKFFGGK